MGKGASASRGQRRLEPPLARHFVTLEQQSVRALALGLAPHQDIVLTQTVGVPARRASHS